MCLQSPCKDVFTVAASDGVRVRYVIYRDILRLSSTSIIGGVFKPPEINIYHKISHCHHLIISSSEYQGILLDPRRGSPSGPAPCQ